MQVEFLDTATVEKKIRSIFEERTGNPIIDVLDNEANQTYLKHRPNMHLLKYGLLNQLHSIFGCY